MPPNIIFVLFLWICSFYSAQGYPEIGFLGKLESDVTRTSAGWQKISNWKTSLTNVKGLYNFDASLATSGDISIPVTGIFFISVSLPVANADIGLFKAALIINDVTTDKSIGLSCRMENMTSGTQMLSVAGFLSLRADEKVAIYAYSGIDTTWSIKSQSSFTFHYFGRFGSTPGFLAHPMSSLTITNPNAANINTWRTTGRGGLFQSLTGFTKSNGKFTTVCSGLYILTANIIFEGGIGDYSLTTLFNVKSSIVGKTHMSKPGLVTVNVYQAFSLPKGTAVDIGITSDAGQIKVLEQSSWSMAFIGSTSTNTREFASYLTSSVDVTGGQWSELSGLLRDSATQAAMGSSTGQFLMPSNLNLINTKNFAVTDQTELYYAFAHLVYSGNATNIESMIAVSPDKSSATGKEGIYGSITKASSQSGTMSLSGIFHIRKQEHLNILIKTANANDKFTVHNTSFIAFVRMRYVVSAFSARINTKIIYQKSGWNEVTGPWLTETYGLYSYGKDFSATTGRFTASHTGVYMIAANIQINKGNGAVIGLTLAKNGIVDLNNGMYAVDGEPSTKTTLNLYGSVSAKTGEQLSLFAYKSTALDWEVDVKSGFSITYVGPNWAVYGFHGVLANDQHKTTIGTPIEIDGWTTNSQDTTMTYVNNIGFSSKRYTSPVDGIYVVSANLYLQNISFPGGAAGDGWFHLAAYIGSQGTYDIGLEDSKPSYAETSRDYFTLSFSGSVRIKKGEYISLFLLSTADGSYVISKQSGFSVVLVSLYTNSHSQGLLASKNVVSYLNTANAWTGVVDLSTERVLALGRYVAGNGLGTTPDVHYSVAEPGIYYVTGNIKFDNAGGGSLFEIQGEIDSESSQNYGMYAVESSPKGSKYNLNFAGSVYLTYGQQIKLKFKTAKTSYHLDKGTGFSIIKLQLDEHFPGVVVDKYDASFSSNQLVSDWEESTKPGLLTSNIGYKAITGSYSPPVSGIYIVSINNYLNSATDTTSISLIDSGNTNTIKAYSSYGDNRTMLASAAVYLDSNTTFRYLLNSTTPKSYTMEAGWSLYFIKTLDLIEGFASRLFNEFIISSSDQWITVSNWTNISSNDFSSRSSATLDSYYTVSSGAHFISFSPVAMHSTVFDFKVAVFINSSVALMASFDSIPANKATTLTVSGTLKLSIGDLVEFRVYSSASNVRITTETSRSLIFIDGITTHTEGVAGQKASNEIINGAKTSPKQISNFDTTKPGAFSARNGTLTDLGSLVNFHAGVFLYSTNIIVLNSAATTRKFRLYSVINSEAESSFTLQSIQTIDANKKATLSLSSTIFLPRFSQVQTLITTDDDNSFQIVANSTFSFILVDDNTGPVICEDQGLNMERLVPSDVRISTDKSVTFTCAVVGSLPASLSWYKNGQIIAGQTSSTYTVNPTKISDSASYRCKATYQSLTAFTNNATLSVYDPTPSISAPLYNVSIAENIPVSSLILQTFTVSADKYAINQRAIVSGHIVSGDPYGDFQLSSASTTSINIQPTRALDYEKMSFYSLSITVVNTEEPDAKNTTIIFNITVIDQNDNSPVFTPDVISTAVPEDLNIGSVVYKATAIDKDSGEFGVVTYSIIGNLSRPFFDINSTSGEIFLKKSLDRETEDKFVIIVQAKDSIFSTVAEVVINVTDVNDNKPRFNPEIYTVDVVENILIDTSIIQVFSSDPDLGLNSSMNYSFLNGNEQSYFKIDSSTGVIRLAKLLDYETKKQFNLSVGLNDIGSPMLQSSNNATVIINIVDINDNFPIFELSLYTASIAENENVSKSIIQLKATDKDGTMKNKNVTYSINQTLASSFFQIDKYTGIITLKAKVDYELYKRFDFSVIASDSGHVSYTRHTNVIIYITDVNDEIPYFMPTSYNVSISEFSQPGSLIINLYGFDNDTTKSLQYQITSQSPKDDFLLSASSGELMVKSYLDRENISSYTLSVSLSDGVNQASIPATVTLIITDENDNVPEFSSAVYKASLYENASVDAYVLTVGASDLDIGVNAALTYSLLSSNSSDMSSYFSINSTTGVITIAKKLDFETTPKCNFFVVATDAGRVPLHGHAIVDITIIDINDNAPYFSPNMYTANISEAANIGSIVALLKAFDVDSTSLTYEIIAGNTDSHFKIVSNVLMTSSYLDFENIKSYNLIVRAFDGIHYSTTNASVIINVTDINDNNPVFNQSLYTVTIPEDTNTSNVIITVFATDGDKTTNNSKIRYSALEVTSDFVLNSITGQITVKNIDYEKQKQYSLIVMAQDYGSPSRLAYSRVDIIITDVNDNAPVISPTSYSANISEATIVNTQIVVVMATDADSLLNGEVVYSIVAGNEAQKFTIQPDTGIISLAATLNYEGASRAYNLVVSVNDKGGKTAAQNASVVINVLDVNDNQPIFDLSNYWKTISEITQNGSSILTVHAADNDGTSINSNMMYYIVSNADSGNFSINSTSGVIYSASTFDREAIDSYSFQIEARDTGNSMLKGRCMVKILISDYNDNAPAPDSLSYQLNISVKANVGSQVLTIFATDRDIGMNSRLKYSIQNGNRENTFAINEKGVITLTKILDTSLYKYFDLKIMITDEGTPSLNTNVTVMVNITDIPMSSISFQKAHYIFTFNESILLHHIGQVKAVDTGNLTSKFIIYEMLANNMNGVFVHSSSGDIYLNTTVDYETRNRIDFTVKARNDLGVSAYTHVTIIILDVNERPYFINTINGSYTFNISESVSPYTFIHSVIAKDNDTGMNGQLTFSLILSSSFQNTFFIDQQGRIYTKTLLDYESTKKYTFQVQVEDKGNPSLSATAVVNIDILDYNDNHPVFVFPTPQNITVLENSVSGMNVGMLNATDADSAENGQIRYIGIYPNGFLIVNESTGVLSIDNSANIDYEKTQTVELIAIVRDLGTPHLTTTTNIRLNIENVNDNDPYFIQSFYNITISEVTQVGSLIIPLHALDNDLGLPGTIKSYTIASGDLSKFKVDSTGKLTLVSQLSYSVKSSYHLMVNVTDNGTPARYAQANVYIYVADLSRLQPVFLSNTYYKTVNENNQLNEIILQVNATTAEAVSGPLYYSILSNNNDSQYFTIDNTTGIIRNLISFDYESQRMFTFTVQVLDSHNQKTGISHVIIYVTDMNDNTPQFINTKATYNISEATSLGTLVFTLSASDNDSTTNGMVTFVPLYGNGMDKFTVEPNGKVYLKNTVDSKVRNNYTLTIKVEDMGKPSLHSNITVMIYIEPANLVHLSQPIFNQSSYIQWVDEGITKLALITVKATNQAISSTITYSLVGELSETNPFSITASGEINLNIKLDYITKKRYAFQVKAMNSEGRFSTAPVTIYVRDVNDRRPYFMPSAYNVDISECSLIGQHIVQLLTKDNDTAMLNSVYHYQIVSGNDANKFNITNTGLISLMNPIDFESMVGTSYDLVASVQEGNNQQTANATVKINIKDCNDVTPAFNRSIYTFNVSEAAPLLSSIGMVHASDGDRTNGNNIVSYSLATGGNDFTLSNDGNLTIKSRLNYVNVKQYELVAIATDNGNPTLKGTAVIKINVIDVNDQYPSFKETYYYNNVSEAFPIGGIVLSVKAYDDDSGMAGTVSYNLTDPSSTFKIDANGRITLMKKLNYEQKQNYTLIVDAIDGGGLVSKQSATVVIVITEVNDNQPLFTLSYYTFDASEDVLVGSEIGIVKATDYDRIKNDISYSLVANSDAGNFTIHNNGSITLSSALDYERIKQYTFMVKATDQGNPNLHSEAHVTVVCLDVNDNYPIPSESYYSLNISEKTTVGSQILTIFASDKDSGENARLTYTKQNGDPSNSFFINSKGQLLVMKALDSYTQPSFNITVRISDNGAPQKFVDVSILIRVIPISLDQIRCEKAHYVFNVTENVLASPFGPIKAVDTGNYTSSKISYEVFTNQLDVQNIFFLDKNTGLIYMNNTVNYEQRSQYDFQTKAVNDRGFITYCHVTVKVTDANEKVFFTNTVNGSYYFNISESVHVGSFVGHIDAQDYDTKSTSSHTYSITSASISSLLTIDNMGNIYTNSMLDYEMNKTIIFNVTVNDAIGTSSVTVYLKIIDYNDNHPVFIAPTPSTLTLPENVTSGTEVGRVNANDQDSTTNGMVFFKGVYPTGILKVNETTGVLQADNVTILDYEKVQSYELLVIAQDRGVPSLMTTHKIHLNIENINDNSPYFDPMLGNINFMISEDTPVGTLFISLKANDNDLGMAGKIARYGIIAGDTSNTFQINNVNGIITLRSKLNYNVKSYYTLTVQATDAGIPTRTGVIDIKINVTAFTKNPHFTLDTYYVSVYEDIANLSNILQVNAASYETTSGPFVYSIQSNNYSSIFNINSSTGVIRNTKLLDYEQRRFYTFIIQVKDTYNNRMGVAHVVINIIDVNDNSPMFMNTSLTHDISEATPVGTVVLTVRAQDKDSTTNGQIVFKAVDGDGMNKFSVEPDGRVLLTSSLDSKINHNFTLVITALDLGTPSRQTNITVVFYILPANLMHLSLPVFNQSVYNAWVDEGILIASFLQVHATNQAIAGQIIYSIKGTSSETSPFSINSTSGELSVTTMLNYEVKRMYKFEVTANNVHGRTATAFVNIYVRDKNDNRPVFSPLQYTAVISEYAKPSDFVAQLFIKDNDTFISNGPHNYVIKSGNNPVRFNVSNTGLISVANSIDYESLLSSTIILKISVAEASFASISEATVNIRIRDENDNSPRFNQSVIHVNVTEGQSPGFILYNVTATDKDATNMNNQITYSLVTKETKFEINNNGQLRIKEMLNYEEKKSYELVVKATDNGAPALTGSVIVIINIIDDNDNAPVFLNPCSNVIPETFPIGSTVVECPAIDADSSPSLVYKINGTDVFTVDNKGKITLSKPLDSRITTSYNLTLTVSDGVHSTRTLVRITIVPFVFCSPLFNQSLYTGYVIEGSPIQTSILTVAANDSRNSTFTYSIEAGVTAFSIGSDGVIKTKKLLDYNVKNMYIFKVYATGGSYVAESVVIIYITDINNKLPVPGKLSYTVQISEKAAIGAIVIGINASDPDTKSKFTYSILSGDRLGHFRVDSNGLVRVNKPLNYELIPYYNLKVSVSDGIHEVAVPVAIQVVDVVEPTTCGPCLQCPPVSKFDFMKSAYKTISISESTMAGNVIANVQLNQEAQNNLISANYSIEDATARMYFSVNNTGKITLNKKLDAMTLLSLRKFTFTVYNHFKCRKASTEIIVDSALTGCAPQFKKNSYQIDIFENYPLHRIFLIVETKLFSSSAIYSIEENLAKTIFSINESTGGISLVSALDYEKATHHVFTVKVNITNLISYKSVVVNVKDVNDNCPQLSSMDEVLYQPIQVGAICGYIQMNDSDTFKNHTFTIISGDVNNNFTIDNNGLLRARTIITTQTKAIYNLVVAVDDGVCTRSTSIRVTVNKDTPPPCPSPPSCYNYTCAPCPTTQPLTKCPDKFCPGCPVCPTTSAPCPTTKMTTACPVKTCPTCPSNCSATVTCPACPTLKCPSCLSYTKYIFKQAYYSISVYENTTVTSYLLTVHINGALTATYSIVETNATSMFNIDLNTGKISLKKALDYTKQKMHQFTVRATVGGEYSDATVVVHVLDVNNNCPVFSQSQTYTRLTSPVESGTIIAWNKATDVDVAPSLTYQIVSGDSSGEFAVDNMGVIKAQKRIVIAGSKTYNITIRASDGVCSKDSHSVVVIHLDTMFTVTPSKCPVYCPVCPLCTSAPSTASCQNVTTVVNQTTCPTCPTKCATCVKPAGYMFTLAHYWTTLNENTTYSNPILTVKLAGSIAANFSIVEANSLTYFKINKTTGDLSLVKELDYEKIRMHNFTVKATFANAIESFVPITVYVTNINDNNPYYVISSYTVTVHEYTVAGALVVQVRATDVDDKNSVRMSITSGDTNNVFSIDSSTGVISLAKQPYMFIKNTYHLQITLSDTGNRYANSYATVIVHIERLTSAKAGCSIYGNEVYMTKSLSENSPIGTLVQNSSQGSAAGNRNIIYSIANNEAMMLFQINTTTGKITTKAMLDYEKKTSHVIVVSGFDPVTNLTSSSIIYVSVINIDEYPLTFGSAPSHVTVSELASVSTYVAEIKATDADGSTMIRNHITAGNNDGTFVIDPITGIIRLNKTLNHQHNSSHALTICAIDGHTSASLCHNVTVNVKNENNNNIVFSKTSYISPISSNATVGTVVTTVSASDPDNLGPLTFSLSGTTANEYFQVDSSGVVRVKKALSASALPSPYILMVCATDSGTPATKQCVPVIVSIGSSVTILPNNYDPYFTQTSFNAVVNENVTVGTTVMKIIATDNDTGMPGLVHYNTLSGLNNDYFKVDELTGAVTTLKVLNTSSTPKAFFFTMDVRDHGSPVRYSRNSINISIGIQSPVWVNNTILSVSSLTMDVVLSKDPFIDSKIIQYQVVAQEYDPAIQNFNDLSAMSPVSWYYVNFIPATYHHRRFIVATITPVKTSRRKRREVLENNQQTHLKFRAGNEQGCELKTLESSVCNGPLMPGKSYRFQLVGYYADNSPVTGAFTNPSATSVSSISTATGVLNSAYIATYWIIGLVVLSLMFFIAVLAIVILLCYKKRYMVYTMGAKTFANPMYADQPLQKKSLDDGDDMNFYASDTIDGYSSIDTLKNKQSASHHVDPEEFEMIDHQPIGTLGVHHSFQNYETVSDQVTFEEENPEWVSMDISLKVDPSGKTDPVIMTRGERSSDSSSSKKASVSSDGSHEGRKSPPHIPPDYDDVPGTADLQGVRISVTEDDDDGEQGITKL